jgi:pyruvate/2-oxoglutarate dehydrogenase complex dihydrolipoamide acyltransferase (E2) component
MIAEYELDPSKIEGTGEGGKITKPDVDTYLAGEDPGVDDAPGDEDEVE